MPFPYLYDPTGMLPANQVVDELHHVTPPVALDRANFIVPRAAPYFTAGLVIRTGAGALAPALIEGTDYIFTHHFVEASQHLNAPIYGSIMFMNRAYVGDVYLNYQTIGGAFTLDDYGVVESLTRSLYNIRTVTWDQILGVPVAFPVVPHPHDVADLTGMAEVVTMLGNILTALQGQGGNIGSLMSTLVQHIGGSASHNKSQVGLEHVQNYGMAGTPELTTLPANKYVSPEWVWAAIELFNLGEAGVSQSTESVVGITRYATDVEVIDQDNPLDTVAVTAAGMWLAIATNTERLAGATIVTGVDFNTPPYREDGYWAFTNAINTSITPSSGYISTKKAGNKAYQTETLDNGEISNRMYTGTAWTPWIRAYVATYYGSIPVNILAGNIDLNDYPLAGFYTFDTHNIIGHAPPSYGVSSAHEMVVYQSNVANERCQVTLNLTANRASIRTFNALSMVNASAWTAITAITGVAAGNTPVRITAVGVWLILSTDFIVVRVVSDPTTSTVINIVEHGAGPIAIWVLIDDGVNTTGWNPLNNNIYTTFRYYGTQLTSQARWIGADRSLLSAMQELLTTPPLNQLPAVQFLSIDEVINPSLTMIKDRLCSIINDELQDTARPNGNVTVVVVVSVYRINTSAGSFYSHSATVLDDIYPTSAVVHGGLYQTEVSIDTPTLYAFVRYIIPSIDGYTNVKAVVYSYPFNDGVTQVRSFDSAGISGAGHTRVKPNATGVWGSWF